MIFPKATNTSPRAYGIVITEATNDPSIDVLEDGTWVNRWADPRNPNVPAHPSMSKRFDETQRYIQKFYKPGV